MTEIHQTLQGRRIEQGTPLFAISVRTRWSLMTRPVHIFRPNVQINDSSADRADNKEECLNLPFEMTAPNLAPPLQIPEPSILAERDAKLIRDT